MRFYPPTIASRIKTNILNNLPVVNPFTSELEMALTDIYCFGMFIYFA